MHTSVTPVIEIVRDRGTLKVFKAIMPIWTSNETSKFFMIDIPMLGIRTMSNTEEDSEKFINEAIACFCLLAEESEHGIIKELENTGWSIESDSVDKTILKFNSGNFGIESMVHTGSRRVLEVAC